VRRFVIPVVVVALGLAGLAPADLAVVIRDRDGKAVGQPVPVPPGGWAAVVEVPGQPPAPPQPPAPQPADALLPLHNAERAKAGAGPLTLTPALVGTAQRHADWMAANGRQAHDEPGASFVQRLNGAGYLTAGENICEQMKTARDALNIWLSDGPHRRNALNPQWKQAGFGVAVSKSGVAYWCADFGIAPGR
jgi:uncharacterized protein YkwD